MTIYRSWTSGTTVWTLPGRAFDNSYGDTSTASVGTTTNTPASKIQRWTNSSSLTGMSSIELKVIRTYSLGWDGDGLDGNLPGTTQIRYSWNGGSNWTTAVLNTYPEAKSSATPGESFTLSGFTSSTNLNTLIVEALVTPGAVWDEELGVYIRTQSTSSMYDLAVDVQTGVSSVSFLSGDTSRLRSGAGSTYQVVVSGDNNQGINWTCSGGTISGAGAVVGNYAYCTWTPPGSDGTYTLTATSALDGTKSYTFTIYVGSFTTSISPSSRTVNQYGGSQTLTWTLTETNSNLNETLTFSASGQPSGVSISFNPTSLVNTGGDVTVTCSCSGAATPGSYTVTLTATATGESTPTFTQTFTLVIPTLSVSISPTSTTLGGGQTQQFTATVTGSQATAGTWSIPTGAGYVSSSGLYKAPFASGSGTVRFTHTASGQTATATTTYTPGSGGTYTPQLDHVPPTSTGKIIYCSNKFNSSTGQLGVADSTPSVFILDGSNGYWFYLGSSGGAGSVYWPTFTSSNVDTSWNTANVYDTGANETLSETASTYATFDMAPPSVNGGYEQFAVYGFSGSNSFTGTVYVVIQATGDYMSEDYGFYADCGQGAWMFGTLEAYGYVSVQVSTNGGSSWGTGSYATNLGKILLSFPVSGVTMSNIRVRIRFEGQKFSVYDGCTPFPGALQATASAGAQADVYSIFAVG